jgi:uncharacterized protein YndB with AHSA1/START domain
MATIIEERTIEAAPERVFNALTQSNEITRWWANEARVQPEVGSPGEFRFRPPAGTLQFEVAELEPDEKVSWISRQGPQQWAGTSVTWQLAPVQGGPGWSSRMRDSPRLMSPTNGHAGIGTTSWIA